MGAEGDRTFFVESYVPKLDQETAAALSSRLRAAVAGLRGEGISLQWRGSFALVGEETYVWMLGAPDVERVVQVSDRADVRYYNVTEAAVDPPRMS
jgi:hypothetical protein